MSSIQGEGSHLLIIGAGGHARVVLDIILESKQVLGITGFIDVDSTRVGSKIYGFEILGTDEDIGNLRKKGLAMAIIAIGDNSVRRRLAEVAGEMGFSFPTVVHPRATVSRFAHVGEGTVVVAGAVINPGARIGKHVIVNSGATIDHDCVVEDFAHIAPGVHLAGSVTVGSGAHVGLGTNVIESRTIGEWSLIGAGSTVVRDIPRFALAFGTPCRLIRFIDPSH